MKRWPPLLLLVACAELPPLAYDVCGNNLLEAGEDCDRFVSTALGSNLTCGAPDAREAACRVVCDPDRPICPSGWSCRADGVCHHAIGEFEPVLSDVHMVGDAEMVLLAIADSRARAIFVASDHEASLVEVHNGRASAISTLGFDLSLSGAPIAGDYDTDGVEDALLPTVGGLIPFRGRPGPSFSRVDFPYLSYANVATRFWLLPIKVKCYFSELQLCPNPPSLMLFGDNDATAVSLINPEETSALSVPLDAPLESFGDHAPIVDVDGLGFDQEVVLAARGTNKVWVVGRNVPFSESTRPTSQIEQPIELPKNVDQGAIVADVDGDQLADLLISVVDQGVLLARGRRSGCIDGAPFCFSDPIPDDERFDALASTRLPSGTAGHQRFPLAVLDLDGDSFADFVGADGAYATNGTTTLEPVDVRIQPDVPFAEAIRGDFNGDGRDDFAARANGLAELHVWLQADLGGFIKLAYQTVYPPQLLRVGDFDGDQVSDVAFVEASRGNDPRGDAISTLYGARGHPSLVREVAWFDRIERLETARYYSAERFGHDAMDDLLVTWSTVDASTLYIAVLFGNAARAPAAPYRYGNDFTYPTGVLLPGRWGVSGIAGESARPSLYSLPTSPGLRFDRQPAPAMALADLVPPDQVDLACVAWFAQGEEETADIIGGIDGAAPCEPPSQPRLIRIRSSSTSQVTLVDVRALPPLPPIGAIVTISTGDLDADQLRDVVITHQSAVLVRWGADPFGTPAVLSLPGSLVGTAILEADGDPELELAILSDQAIFVADVDPRTRTITTSRRPLPITKARRLAAGDLDGDGLDDLVALGHSKLEVFLARSHLGRSQ